MVMPANPEVLCADWPWQPHPDWIEQFGPYEYFYLAGLNEVLYNNGVHGVEVRRQTMINFIDAGGEPAYPIAYREFFPGPPSEALYRHDPAKYPIPDGKERFAKHRDGFVDVKIGSGQGTAFNRSTDVVNGVRLLVNGHDPKPFGRAIRYIQAVDAYLTANHDFSDPIENHIQIHISNSLVDNFDVVWNQYVIPQNPPIPNFLNNLQVATYQLDQAVLEGIAKGYPVTRRLAERVERFCAVQIAPGTVTVNTLNYRGRTTVGDVDRLTGARLKNQCVHREVVRL